MQPIRLIIHGDFWDSQIYRGRLYLTSMEGSVAVYDWDLLIESLVPSSSDRVAFRCALSRGDWLYQEEREGVFDDPDVKNLLFNKFNRLATTAIDISTQQLDHACLGEVDAPWGLSDDAELYNNHLFAATETGIVQTEIRKRPTKRNKTGIGNTEKLWDGQGLAICIRRGGDLAIAAGGDGLYEICLQRSYDSRTAEPHKLSARHTNLVSYAFASVYGSSYTAGGYLAAYTWKAVEFERRVRQYVKTFDSTEIFDHDGGMSWANQEKLYLSSPGQLNVVRYVQKNVLPDYESESDGQPFEQLGILKFPSTYTHILGGGVPLFGTILEHESGLLIIQSDGHLHQVSGPVTRWRVFPRSKRYENHLHVVFDDHLEIFSFNHDYFVEQHSKLSGIEYKPDRQWGRG